MPGSSEHDAELRRQYLARQAKRAAELRAKQRVSQPGGSGVDGLRQIGRDGDGTQGVVGAAQTPTAESKPMAGGGVQIPNWQEEVVAKHYTKPRPMAGWLARLTGKHLRMKEIKKVGEQQPTTPELKFNLATAAGKGVDPLLTKKAAGVVAIVTALAGGYLGKQVMVDDQSIAAAIQHVGEIYTAVMTLIAGVTWFWKVIHNVYTEWERITTHGVKISGPNADMAFDFAPKDQDEGNGK